MGRKVIHRSEMMLPDQRKKPFDCNSLRLPLFQFTCFIVVLYLHSCYTERRNLVEVVLICWNFDSWNNKSVENALRPAASGEQEVIRRNLICVFTRHLSRRKYTFACPRRTCIQSELWKRCGPQKVCKDMGHQCTWCSYVLLLARLRQEL